jgi:hypothetical protein
LIDARKPLVHERGDPEEPNLVKNIEAELMEPTAVAPFVTPQQLRDYDLVIHPISGAQSLGDPLDRDPEGVRSDLENEWTRERVARDIYGVVAESEPQSKHWTVSDDATQERRRKMRETRKERGIPFKQWWAEERQKIEARENMAEAVLDMWRTSMKYSPRYAEELRAFWNLPEGFTF